MAGTLFGRAQRYINDVKSEVSREMELDELRKMHKDVQDAASDVSNSIHKSMSDTEASINDAWNGGDDSPVSDSSSAGSSWTRTPDPPARDQGQGLPPQEAGAQHRRAGLVQAPERPQDPRDLGLGTGGQVSPSGRWASRQVSSNSASLHQNDPMAEENTQAEETFISHLIELRSRIVKAAAVVLVVFLCLMPFAAHIFDVLAAPMIHALPAGSKMIATGVITPS
jgi:hypothetical protein